MTAWCFVKVGTAEFVAEGELGDVEPLLRRFLAAPGSDAAGELARRDGPDGDGASPPRADPLELRAVPPGPSLRGRAAAAP